MEEYIKWLENKIEVCLEDKDLQREHWAFCQALKKYRELALRQPPVIPRLFFVVTASHEIEGNWEQLSNGLKTYEDAVRYRDEPFTKKRHPYAYIVASLNEV
jgi:hypothetical protein